MTPPDPGTCRRSPCPPHDPPRARYLQEQPTDSTQCQHPGLSHHSVGVIIWHSVAYRFSTWRVALRHGYRRRGKCWCSLCDELFCPLEVLKAPSVNSMSIKLGDVLKIRHVQSNTIRVKSIWKIKKICFFFLGIRPNHPNPAKHQGREKCPPCTRPSSSPLSSAALTHRVDSCLKPSMLCTNLNITSVSLIVCCRPPCR